MKGSSHRKVTDRAFRMSEVEVRKHRSVGVDEVAEVDNYRDLELVDVEGASSSPRDNPHQADEWYVAEDDPIYERTVVGHHFNHTAFNHFIDIKKGVGQFDDYDGYAYEKGSARRDGHEIYVNNHVDMLINYHLNDEYVHVPGRDWYRGCSPSVERYSFPEEKNRYKTVWAELRARFPLATSRGGTNKGIPYSVFMPADNMARYWYEHYLFGNYPIALGPVMHVIQDASIPHHAAGYNGNWHSKYEEDLEEQIDGWLGDRGFRTEVKELHDKWLQSDTSQPDRLDPSHWRLIPSDDWRIDYLVTWVALNAYREYDQTYRHFRHGYRFELHSARELTKIAAAMSLLILSKTIQDKFKLMLLGAADKEKFNEVYGLKCSLRCYNFPQYFVRHDGRISKLQIAQDWQSGIFKIVWGLADPNEGVSIESIDQPGYYLRCRSTSVLLEKADEGQSFKADATFHLKQGLANRLWSSFESFTRPGYYLRHRDCQLHLDKLPASGEADKSPLTPGKETPPPGKKVSRFTRDSTFLLARPRIDDSGRQNWGDSRIEHEIDNMDDRPNGTHLP